VIAVAGSIVCDVIKTVDAYPQCGTLADVKRVSMSVGGCVPNTGITLAALGGVKVTALGAVGDDGEGRFILQRLKASGIDVAGIVVKPGSTGFTDVINVEGGERTFFHWRGVNAGFGPGDVAVGALDCRILHIGYQMLLDRFDAPDDENGTVMAAFLRSLREKGIKTSIDTASGGGDLRATMLPALKHCDYVIINEFEGGRIAGIEPRDAAGRLLADNIAKILEELVGYGVGEKAVIHCPEGGYCLCRKGGFTHVPSLKLPAGYIKGKVGAGDAFCAGALYGIYNNFDDEAMLEAGNCTAVRNLASSDSVSGACSFAEVMELKKSLMRLP